MKSLTSDSQRGSVPAPIRHASACHKISRRLIKPVAIAAGMMTMASVLGMTLFALDMTGSQFTTLIAATLGSCLVAVVLYMSAHRADQDKSQLEPGVAPVIYGVESIRIWGAVECSRDRMWRRARRELMSYLPKLGEDHGNLMTDRQLADLREIVTPKFAEDDPYLVVEVIKALERIGDTGCLALVQKLAADEVMEPVRGVANRCLPGLEQRHKELAAAGTLLRPSDSPGEEALLRPARLALEVDPNLLLRQAQVPGD